MRIPSIATLGELNWDEAEAVPPFDVNATFVRPPGVGVGFGVGVTFGVGVAFGVGATVGVGVGVGVEVTLPPLHASSSTILL